MRRLAALCMALLPWALLACGEDKDHHAADAGGQDAARSGSGATCPSTQTLTYDNFGRDFMQRYCLRCHSSTVKGASRQGAPDDHNFDTRDEIRGVSEHIDQRAGAGPKSANTDMPRNAPAPTPDERKKLAEWLACGAP